MIHCPFLSRPNVRAVTQSRYFCLFCGGTCVYSQQPAKRAILLFGPCVWNQAVLVFFFCTHTPNASVCDLVLPLI